MAEDTPNQADDEKLDELEEQIQDLDVPDEEAKDVKGGALALRRRTA
jgi:hypothetical protein